MKNLTYLLFILISNLSFGQIISDRPVDVSKISEWNSSSLNEYEELYFFGFSEAETQLTIAIHDTIICVQLKSYDWVDDENGDATGWHARYENYTNVKIIGNKFYSDQSSGEFLLYDNQKCLKFENPPIQIGKDGDYELGLKSTKDLHSYYDGRLKKAIFKILDEDYLMKLSLEDLQIMRNEVYARYGYIFMIGGEMEAYFKKQTWYSGQFENVDNFITEIEKANIALIQKVEEAKKN